MTDVYQHQQLQSKRAIRVLELAPAKNLNAPIHCKLIETSLAEVPPARLTYEALSYAWGSPHRDRQILCGGKTLLVTANCDAALRRLRNKTNSRFLWIDSICIDQSSIKERNEQVRLMADVYALAKQVIVWLRDAGEYTTTTFLALRALVTLQNYKSSSFLVPRLAKRLALSLRPGIKEVLASSWFWRVWTLQEIGFARNAIVLCGRSKISWEKFVSAFDLLERAYYATEVRDQLAFRSHLRTQVALYRSRYRYDQDAENIAPLWLRRSWQNEAANPKDKVYGIYGIFGHFGITLPEPDYGKDVAYIFEECAVSLIQKTGTLSVICYAGTGQNQHGIPSWVPDWSSGGKGINTILADLYPKFRAAGQSKSICESTRLWRHLDLTGRLFAKVKVRGRPMLGLEPDISRDPSGSYLEELLRIEINRLRVFSSWARMAFGIESMEALGEDGESWKRVLSRVRSQYPTGESFPVAFYRTLTRNETTVMWQHEEWDRIFHLWIISVFKVRGLPLESGESVSSLEREVYDVLLGVVPSNSIKLLFQQLWPNRGAHRFKVPRRYHEYMYLASELYDNMKPFHDQDTFFITTTGHMGTTSHTVQADDMAVLFAGCNLPMIIRPEGDHYRLISPAYIHGIMQGEAWPKDVSVETLEKFTLM